MPGQTRDEFTWLESGFEVTFQKLGFEVLTESLLRGASKKCACLAQHPRLPNTVTLNRVRCETDHYILCDQWKGKVVKNSLL